MLQDGNVEIICLSSLAKVFADGELNALPWNKGSMLCNEVYSFQVAYRWNYDNARPMDSVSVHINSELSDWIMVRKVELSPSDFPIYADHDDNILRSTPGLFPDLLRPVDQYGITLVPGQWRSLWITVSPKADAKPGSYPIGIAIINKQGEELCQTEFLIDVLEDKLPRQSLIHTEWFHTDCIANWYKADVFSEDYWNLVEKYIQTAVEHGINMILTPLFTPPLDTRVGGERLTVQLVDVVKADEIYKFGYKNLKRWIDMCLSNGVEYFEFSHFFTQWGAKHAPKIIASVNGKLERIFGWETDATGDAYKNFLDQFLPSLVDFLKENNLEERSYFHISDEPSPEHIESYRSASSIIKKHLNALPIMDALSSYIFYENGLVGKPIPSNNRIEVFIENGVPHLWTYYCCSQYKHVSNRFFCMPSANNRIIGIQLYKFKIAGFLHWGYNFWNCRHSLYSIDPFRVTDAACSFPSGDPFLVYPGEDGPLESLRMEVFYEALQDLRALKLLEEKIGYQEVMNLLEKDLHAPITFSEYPKDEKWLLNKREEINRLIMIAGS